jgi:hypothetical protein
MLELPAVLQQVLASRGPAGVCGLCSAEQQAGIVGVGAVLQAYTAVKQADVVAYAAAMQALAPSQRVAFMLAAAAALSSRLM